MHTMKHRQYIRSSSTGVAYLIRAWEDRTNLESHERRGFGQHFYMMLSSHLESVICRKICLRFDAIHTFVGEPSRVKPLQMGTPQGIETIDPASICLSIRRICDRRKQDIAKAAYERLKEEYRVAFAKPLPEVLGQDLFADLEALFVLRNILAHGREIYLEHEIDPEGVCREKLDGNPLKTPIDRLVQAGILERPILPTFTIDRFLTFLSMDEALRYFYESSQQIENLLICAEMNVFERSFFAIGASNLPDLT
jgi:hypothetical protein